jgi:hypothetical protein
VNKLQAPTSLKGIASLPPASFAQSLPALKDAMQKAAQTKTIVPNETLQQIAQRLQGTSESSPDYWPVVLQFIQFASAASVSPTDIPPANSRYSIASDIRCVGFARCIVASHCAFILDGGSIPNSIFDHCRIKFTNNPVELKGTRFIDCLFEMPTDITRPIPYLKKSAKELLASDLRQVMFPG